VSALAIEVVPGSGVRGWHLVLAGGAAIIIGGLVYVSRHLSALKRLQDAIPNQAFASWKVEIALSSPGISSKEVTEPASELSLGGAKA